LARGYPAHRFARQIDTLDALHQTVEDGIGDGGVADAIRFSGR
jgi:hypothetical protein